MNAESRRIERIRIRIEGASPEAAARLGNEVARRLRTDPPPARRSAGTVTVRVPGGAAGAAEFAARVAAGIRESLR